MSESVRLAVSWVLFFALVMSALWAVLLGIKYYEDRKAECEQAGGVMVRNMQCVEKVDISSGP